MSDDEDSKLNVSDDESEVLSESESESEEEEEVEVPKVKKMSRVTETKLGEILKSTELPPKAKRAYATRKPLSEEAKEGRRQNMAKARAARSAYAAARRVVALKQQLTKYDIQESSSSEDEEIYLSKKPKAKVLPTKKQEKLDAEKDNPPILAKTKKTPKDHIEKIVVDGAKTLAKKKSKKETDERIRLLEAVVLDSAKKDKKNRSRKTIININKSEDEKTSVVDSKKIFLDLGI